MERLASDRDENREWPVSTRMPECSEPHAVLESTRQTIPARDAFPRWMWTRGVTRIEFPESGIDLGECDPVIQAPQIGECRTDGATGHGKHRGLLNRVRREQQQHENALGMNRHFSPSSTVGPLDSRTQDLTRHQPPPATNPKETGGRDESQRPPERHVQRCRPGLRSPGVLPGWHLR